MIDQSLPPNKSYTKSLGKWVSGDKSHEHLLKAKNMRDIYRERVQVFTSFFNPFKKGVLFIFQTVTFFTSDHIMLSNFQYAQQSWMEFKRILDIMQHWKILEIWNPFHGQKYLISKWFSNFECTGSKIWLYFNGWLFLQAKI